MALELARMSSEEEHQYAREGKDIHREDCPGRSDKMHELCWRCFKSHIFKVNNLLETKGLRTFKKRNVLYQKKILKVNKQCMYAHSEWLELEWPS